MSAGGTSCAGLPNVVCETLATRLGHDGVADPDGCDITGCSSIGFPSSTTTGCLQPVVISRPV